MLALLLLKACAPDGFEITSRVVLCIRMVMKAALLAVYLVHSCMSAWAALAHEGRLI